MNFEFYKNKLVKKNKKQRNSKFSRLIFYIGDAYADFKEADIEFPPTYKYDLRFDNAYAKHRTPSYTVRIIFRIFLFEIKNFFCI